MLTRRVTTLLATTSTAAVLAVGGSAIASNGVDDAPVASPSPLAMTPVIGAIEPAQAAAFQVMRRPQRPSDAMPADIAAAMAGPSRFGRNAGLSRAIRTPTGKGWVVPGRGVICLVVPDAAGVYGTTCQTTAAAAEDGVTLQQVGSDESSSSTLLPDGGTLVVTQDDASTDVVQPDASGVASADTTDAERVTVVSEDGRSTTPVPEPDGTVAPTG
ncbi:hypothetical protein [Patulibacter americanus]|uniref:hypothetical protein n=1 Tax=Patulibacter americanus TaxID=588672 RepID=UPI0003B3C387|nr:hypothetical protein [Patulibacter americanus]